MGGGAAVVRGGEGVLLRLRTGEPDLRRSRRIADPNRFRLLVLLLSPGLLALAPSPPSLLLSSVGSCCNVSLPQIGSIDTVPEGARLLSAVVIVAVISGSRTGVAGKSNSTPPPPTPPSPPCSCPVRSSSRLRSRRSDRSPRAKPRDTVAERSSSCCSALRSTASRDWMSRSSRARDAMEDRTAEIRFAREIGRGAGFPGVSPLLRARYGSSTCRPAAEERRTSVALRSASSAASRSASGFATHGWSLSSHRRPALLTLGFRLARRRPMRTSRVR